MSLRPLQIGAAAIVGFLIGGVTVLQIGADPIQRALSAARSNLHSLIRSEAPAAPRDNQALQREASEQARASALRDEQARQLRADQQRAAGGAGSEALEAAARKERAWNRFYKKPTQCDGNPSNEAMTECANLYIRAKREFEDAYAAGKL